MTYRAIFADKHTWTMFIFFFWMLSVLSSKAYGVENKNYIKKSISVPNFIVGDFLFPETYRNESSELKKIILESIKLPRFDQNSLPDSLFKELLKKDISPSSNNSIAIIEEAIIPEIEKILNDPEIQKKRIEHQKKPLSNVSFATTKGKASNILAADLDILFNSAYIAIPILKEIKININTHLVETHLSVKIYLYQIKTKFSGKMFIERLPPIIATAKNTDRINNYNNVIYSSLISDALYINKIKASLRNVSQSIGNIIELEIKRRPEFLLSGRVLEVDKTEYSLNFNNQSIELDDTFILMEFFEENNKNIAKEVGFLRITNTGEKDPSLLSHPTGKQILGKTQSNGGWVKEYPTTPLTIEFSLGTLHSIAINNNDFPEINTGEKSGHCFSTKISNNLAKVTGISQLFLNLYGTYSIIEKKHPSNTMNPSYLKNFGASLQKKYFYKNHSISWEMGLGNATVFIKDSQLTQSLTHYSYYVDLNEALFRITYSFSLTKHTALTMGLSHFLTTGINKSHIEKDTYNKTYHDSNAEKSFSKSSFNRNTYEFGISYNLKTFAFQDTINLIIENFREIK